MIKLTHVDKTFHLKSGDVHAVNDVSLTINDGEIFGIIGYSGAGKSTLVRCINLLETPDSGEIEVNGQKMTWMGEVKGTPRMCQMKSADLRKARQKIGMIFQHFNLLDRSTVFDNIAYPLRFNGHKKEEIEKKVTELLKLVDLEDKRDVYPSQLSGGQKQRVAIARALANDPQVLLSDEATSALDPEATESILHLLRKLNRQLGITIVIITHEMAVIKTACHRVAVMENGSVVEEGDVYDIFANPKQPITEKFVSSASSLSRIKKLLKIDPSLADPANGKLIKLVFGRNATGEALISSISREFNVNISIVLANVEIIQNDQLGAMIGFITGDEKNIHDAIECMKNHHVVVSNVLEQEESPCNS